jgi:DNA adenine methylase
MTDIQRAIKWFYLLKAAFGGHMVKASFGYGTTDRSRLNILDLEETILQIHWRLASVTIETLPYRKIVGRYDRSHTFFYLDPPYYGMKVYRLNFEPKDFDALAQALARIKGRFLMSLNDHPEVRKLFSGFKIRPVALKYSCMGAKSTGRGTTRGELLISNY